jgi:dTDP-4-dehydrorhamnose 3,5-epimerase
MKVAVTGAGGQLGRALTALLPDAGFEAVALHRADLDVTDAAAVAARDWAGVDVIVNAAAYTAVDGAETPEGRVAAWAANATAVAHLAAAASAHGATLVHVSSEYVFDGAYPGPIPEDAPLCPLSAYGASKAAGDVAAALAAHHLIVRTSWVVGEGGNFVRTMLGLAARGVSPAVVDDQIGRPTFAEDLAAGIVALLRAGAPSGTWNLTNGGEPASWAEVARATFALAGREPGDVTTTTTAAYFADKPQAARRPLNSVLDLGKAAAAGVSLPPWRESLESYVKQETAR